MTSSHSQFVYSFFFFCGKIQLFRIFKLDFRLVTRKESDLQLCLDVKAAKSWKKADQTRHGGCRKCAVSPSRSVLAQFKLPTFNDTAQTVENCPFLGFWKVLYLRTNSVVVGKIQRNLKPRVLVAVAEPSIDAKSRRNVQLLCH